jgi:processive 1,2-diacylglycerol beta-glucosyltransferase
MKILVLYAEAGSGHRMAAQAIAEAVRKKDPQSSVESLDILNLCRPLYAYFYPRIYRFLVAETPFLWGFFFWVLHQAMRFSLFRVIRHGLNAFQASRLVKRLIAEPPDCVVATHFFPLEVVSGLKKSGGFKGQVWGVITDVGVHRLWVHPQVDCYCVASERTQRELCKEGISSDRVSVTGIPVREAFIEARKEYARSKDDSKQEFRILVASGGIGVGPVAEWVQELSKLESSIRVDVVCGENKALHELLQRRVREWGVEDRVVPLGFVRNMHELMAACDVMITKPGGLSIMEAIATCTPLVVTSPIPGQEEVNSSWLLEMGFAWSIKSPSELSGLIQDFCDHPEKLEVVREAMDKKGKPRAALTIAQMILEGAHHERF